MIVWRRLCECCAMISPSALSGHGPPLVRQPSDTGQSRELSPGGQQGWCLLGEGQLQRLRGAAVYPDGALPGQGLQHPDQTLAQRVPTRNGAEDQRDLPFSRRHHQPLPADASALDRCQKPWVGPAEPLSSPLSGRVLISADLVDHWYRLGPDTSQKCF